MLVKVIIYIFILEPNDYEEFESGQRWEDEAIVCETKPKDVETQISLTNIVSTQTTYTDKCVVCSEFYCQPDSRNEHFGKLVTSELDFVAPCMRTYVHVEVLKLIHKNKYRHMPMPDDVKSNEN